MRILRMLPLTAGLFLSVGAQAEPLSAANQDMLDCLLRAVVGTVLLIAALATIVLITAAATRAERRPAAPASLPADAAPAAAAPRLPQPALVG